MTTKNSFPGSLSQWPLEQWFPGFFFRIRDWWNGGWYSEDKNNSVENVAPWKGGTKTGSVDEIPCCLHLHHPEDAGSTVPRYVDNFTLRMEAAWSSETLTYSPPKLEVEWSSETLVSYHIT